MKNQKNHVDERFYLWWACPDTQRRERAGVAYYNEEKGDYRLMLNFFPGNNYFLKYSGGDEFYSKYKLYAVKGKGGPKDRFLQGEGVLNRSSEEVVIQVAPFQKLLVINLRENDSKCRPRHLKLSNEACA